MKKIRNWFVAILIVASVGGFLTTTAIPNSVSAACDSSFLGFPTWYRGVVDGNCNPEVVDGNISNFIWHIVLNCIEMGLVAVGYLAVFFILFAGFRLLTSTGNAEVVAKARMTILNAVIGLVISVASIAIVRLFFGIIG